MSTADWPSQGGGPRPIRGRPQPPQRPTSLLQGTILPADCSWTSWFPSRLPLALNYNSPPSLQSAFLHHQILDLLSRPQCMSQFLQSISPCLSRRMCRCIHILWAVSLGIPAEAVEILHAYLTSLKSALKVTLCQRHHSNPSLSDFKSVVCSSNCTPRGPRKGFGKTTLNHERLWTYQGT